MSLKIITCILFILGLCNHKPEFRVLSAEKCKWDQGRKEMGIAYKYEVQMVSDRRIKEVTFRYFYIDNHFIPLSKARSYEKIRKNDTLKVGAIYFKNRSYPSDSIFVDRLDSIDRAVLFLHKNEPQYIEVDEIRVTNCMGKEKRL